MNTFNYPFSKNEHRNKFSSKRLIGFAALTIFILSVSSERASAQTFVNPAAINIADNGPAIPAYPSTLNVTGTFGRITKVVVTLNGFTHSFPDDVGVLLVGPAGQKVRLMSDVGGNVAVVTPVNIPIDDRGAAFLPDNGALTNAISKPTAWQHGRWRQSSRGQLSRTRTGGPVLGTYVRFYRNIGEWNMEFVRRR